MLYLVDDAADYRFLVQQVFKLFLPQYSLRLFADGLELIQAIEPSTTLRTIESGEPGKAHQDNAELVDSVSGLARPDLLVLDIDMPKLNGLQTLERLKQDRLWREVPVVMMSNRTDTRFTETAYRLGANSHVIKPLDITELEKVMEQVCQQWLD